MTRNSISSPTLSFVETAVYELQKQMHEKRLELVEAGKAEPAKHESGEANHWHEDFRADMPDKNIVIPYCEAFDGQEKPDFCLLYVPEHSKIIMGTLEFTDPEKLDRVKGQEFFFGVHSFIDALEKAETLLLSDENLTGHPEEWLAPYIPNKATLDTLRNCYQILSLLALAGINATPDMRERYLEALHSLWNGSMKPALDDLLWG